MASGIQILRDHHLTEGFFSPFTEMIKTAPLIVDRSINFQHCDHYHYTRVTATLWLNWIHFEYASETNQYSDAYVENFPHRLLSLILWNDKYWLHRFIWDCSAEHLWPRTYRTDWHTIIWRHGKKVFVDIRQICRQINNNCNILPYSDFLRNLTVALHDEFRLITARNLSEILSPKLLS